MEQLIIALQKNSAEITLALGLAVLVLTIAIIRLSRKSKRLLVSHNDQITQLHSEQSAQAEKIHSDHLNAMNKIRSEHEKSLERYSAIIDIEKEIEKLNKNKETRTAEIDQEIQKLKAQENAHNDNIKEIQNLYREKKSIYDKLQKEISIYDDKLSFIELGVYEPHFDFGDSEKYKDAIKKNRDAQKAMISNKSAVFGTKEWLVDGSKSKGETMINRAVRLTLRAFNNECEAAIANTRWNNALSMENRIRKSREAIHKLNATNNVIISDSYLDRRLEELRLTHEYREKLKKERDERSELARAEREEKRLLQEAVAARKEEEKYQQLLEKARAEAGVIDTKEHEARILELEKQLADAHEKSERAQAMAEKTKSGFVYIISNVGSFGEDVVKIGLTRRLDPMDRVRELGDASVPFVFDTHAMIYSDEAPSLETALHSEFSDRRVNAANMRKEFFRVDLDEVEEAVLRLAPNADFHKDIEAQEFHETLARRKEMANLLLEEQADRLPDEI